MRSLAEKLVSSWPSLDTSYDIRTDRDFASPRAARGIKGETPKPVKPKNGLKQFSDQVAKTLGNAKRN